MSGAKRRMTRRCIDCQHFDEPERPSACWFNPIERKGTCPGCAHHLTLLEEPCKK